MVYLQVISANTADAETKQKAAQEKEAALQVESVQIAKDKVEAEQALSEAIPALEDAAAALNDLKKDDITEIRSFAKPHVLVQRVGSADAWCRAAAWPDMQCGADKKLVTGLPVEQNGLEVGSLGHHSHVTWAPTRDSLLIAAACLVCCIRCVSVWSS